MARDNNKAPDDDITSSVQILERRDLDLVTDIDLSGFAKSASAAAWGGAQFEFLRVKAISRALADKKSDVERYLMEDVLSGLNGLKAPFVYLIIGSKLKVSIYLGILNKSTSKIALPLHLDMLSSSLQSTFPDIELESLSKDDVDRNILQFFHKCKHYGIMTGVPTAKIGVEEHGIEQIERLLRGLCRQEFGYMVIADPIHDIDVIDAFDDIANVIREKSPLIKESKQYTQTSRVIMSGESLNRSMQYYVELLEALLEKLRLAKAQGMWRTMAYFFSPSPATTAKMGNLLKTVFSGEKSIPEAIRTIALNGTNPTAILTKFRQIELELNFHPAFSSDHPLQKLIKHKFASVLNSRDLATLTHLPKEEMPGYDVKDTARFGVCLPDRRPTDTLYIGEIIDRGSGTGNHYGVYVQELVKHGLIAGVTGSGKTNTCLNLLDQLWKGNSGTPFLVIEPAKAEYRSLLNIESTAGTATTATKADVLSDYTWAREPLRGVIDKLSHQVVPLRDDDEWLERTVASLRNALIGYGMQANLIGKRLTPNAALAFFKGSDLLTEAGITAHRSKLLTVHALDIKNVIPEPGKIIITVARPERQTISLLQLWKNRSLTAGQEQANLKLVLGAKEFNGETLYLEPAVKDAPHTLIAGTTGSGKSVLLQNLILDIACTNTTSQSQIYLIDPKLGLDYSVFQNLPHLTNGIVTDQAQAADLLQSIVEEMRRRMALMAGKASNVIEYNNLVSEKQRIPIIWLIHDEFAAWMIDDNYKDLVSNVVQQLGMMARAAGIFLIFAAQRPEARVMTAQLRSNLDNRLILRVSSEADSEMALGERGAEQLLGKGHLVARLPEESNLILAQVPFLTRQQTEDIVKALL